MKPSEYLSLVHAEIADRGWTKKVFQDEFGLVCLRGAMNNVTARHIQLRKMGKPQSTVAYERWCVASASAGQARDMMEDLARSMGADSVIDYNDNFAHAKQDILDFVTKAILSFEEAGK